MLAERIPPKMGQKTIIAGLLAGAIMVLGNTQQEARAEDPQNNTDRIIERLIECESGGNPEAIGDGGKAYGILQFHLGTFMHFGVKYRAELFPNAEPLEVENFYADEWAQVEIARKMLKEPGGVEHWYNCALKIGLL